MAGVIESDSYRDEKRELKADPIIRALAAEVREGLDAGAVTMDEFTHESGAPVYVFMLGASEEYRKRGGKDAHSIGGPARAILALLGEES